MAPARTKECPICCSEVSSFKKSPATCEEAHGPDQRACSECWEAYLSKEVEEKAPSDIKCIFEHDKAVDCQIDRVDLERLAWKDTLIRYDEKTREARSYRCHARCWASKRNPTERNSPSVFQPHDRHIDGRVFTCQFCASQTCIDCDRPEHEHETCKAYRARVIDKPQHVQAEAATAEQFRRCPNCSSFWEWDPKKGKGCGHTVCDACKFRFCGICMIPWVGDGSAQLLGKMGHAEGCRYRGKLEESVYSLKKRFEPDGETKRRVEEKKWAKALKGVAKRKAAEMEEKEESVDGVVMGKVGGSGKERKKRKVV